MSKTITEIAVDVLQQLRRLPDGQTAEPQHVKIIRESYNDLYQELLDDSLVNWSTDDDIPAPVVNSIVILLLGRVCKNFGVKDEWTSKENKIRLKLARLLASPYVAEPTQFRDY